jgi:UPF0755 protein
MPLFRTLSKLLVTVVLLAAVTGAAAFAWWARAPLPLAGARDVTIAPRSSLRATIAQLQRQGVPVQPVLFEALARGAGLAASVKSGSYAFNVGLSPWRLLRKLSRTDPDSASVAIIEGWTFARMRAEIDGNAALTHRTAGMSEPALLAALGIPRARAEGLFYPESYVFDRGAADLDVYRRAYQLEQARLSALWSERAQGLPYRDAYDALVMGSLVEKETARAADRPMVAAVLLNRLRLGMPLQTDPSVIYGLADRYDGRLRRKDLQADGPYNTYTRVGLPPTPIALPGPAALAAALRPADSRALYFVARSDGSSVFSDNLDDHNRAVDKYIRGKQ